jgi:tRNA nucleotidyltransferase (CCA-adding enzyme)
MEVIACHINADFDALASMMAAKKLYPEAHLVFPGSQEKSLRAFFLQSTIYALKHDRVKDIKIETVDRLILVDTKNRERIGKLAEALKNPGVEVHVYDHHPFMEDDIRGNFERVEQLGACTTIFTEILKERGIELTPFEATVMALGIYEETGSLVFASTTPRDISAAAWLLERGANLNIVSDFISRELDREQVGLLDELLGNMQSFYIDGVKVVIATASTSRYVQDLAIITHKLRDIENIDVLFNVVRMEDRIHIVARSRVEEVDAGAVMIEVGGGGHPTAASATVHSTNLDQVVERLRVAVTNSLQKVKLARDIMTSPVITIPQTATMADAGEAMTRYGVNVLPVVQTRKLKGLVTREVVQRAIHHELGGRPLTEFMYTDYRTVAPDTPFRSVEEIMIRHTQRFLPVIEDERVIGAITRTDLLRALHENLEQRPSLEELEPIRDGEFGRKLLNMMQERLPKETMALLREIGQIADDAGMPVFVVGGFVRDLLVGTPNLDLDIVVEGQGIQFAKIFTEKHSGRMRSHQKFGTAVVMLPDGTKFDVASARTEFYEYPAALPTVEMGSIKKDLYRRDFTINALAIKLNSHNFGELIDFFGGQRDLKEKTIRVLHNLSLVEDPTRAYRAIRFEVRMGFTISRHTQNLIKNAAKMELFHRLAGSRVYTELVLIFKETQPLDTMRRLDDFGLIRFIHPKLKFGRDMESYYKNIGETLAWFRLTFLNIEADTWLTYFMALADLLPDSDLDDMIKRLSIPERYSKKIMLAKREGNTALSVFYKNPELSPYSVYQKLKIMPVEALLFMMAKARTEQAKKNISLYLTQYRETEAILKGKDLMALGLRAGPGYKQVLEGLLEAKMDGLLETREDEERFVKRRIAEIQPND